MQQTGTRAPQANNEETGSQLPLSPTARPSASQAHLTCIRGNQRSLSHCLSKEGKERASTSAQGPAQGLAHARLITGCDLTLPTTIHHLRPSRERSCIFQSVPAAPPTGKGLLYTPTFLEPTGTRTGPLPSQGQMCFSGLQGRPRDLGDEGASGWAQRTEQVVMLQGAADGIVVCLETAMRSTNRLSPTRKALRPGSCEYQKDRYWRAATFFFL